MGMQEELKTRMISILQEKRDPILDQHYNNYCLHICAFDRKRRGIDQLKKICMPVRTRFSVILDRFRETLMHENLDYCYGLSESEQDTEHALRFVVPGQHRRLDFHDIIYETEGFVNLVAQTLLDAGDPLLIAHEKDVRILLSKLTYIAFEDLWVSSVVGFRSQNELIQHLLSKLMRGHEEERQNFWRDIHDDFLQVLATTALKLEIIEELSRKNREMMKDEIAFLRKLIAGSTERLRNLCQGFNLSWFERKGLVFSVRAFVKLFEEEFNIPIELGIYSKGQKITGFQGVTLLRIVQEALYNVGKHSKASCGKVGLKVLNGEIYMVVEDDGIGFDVKRTLRRTSSFTHLGLVFMKERVRLLDGSLDIISRKGEGTKLTVRAPLNRGDSQEKWAAPNPMTN